MLDVIVAEHAVVSARAADAFDHRGVVQRVGIDHEVFHDLAKRRQGRVVRHIAGREQESSFLAVKVGQFPLKVDVESGRAGDVARAAGASAEAVDGFVHGVDNVIVLAHAEIVVRAPDGDLALAILEPGGSLREAALVPVKIHEHAVAAFAADRVEGVFERFQVLHGHTQTFKTGRRPN